MVGPEENISTASFVQRFLAVDEGSLWSVVSNKLNKCLGGKAYQHVENTIQRQSA